MGTLLPAGITPTTAMLVIRVAVLRGDRAAPQVLYSSRPPTLLLNALELGKGRSGG
jgi:hypothetical protein